MVSKAKEDFPDPETPVKTISNLEEFRRQYFLNCVPVHHGP